MNKYKKVVKYRSFLGFFEKKDGQILAWGFMCMIPFIGQFVWLMALASKLSKREVHYIEITNSGRSTS